MAIKKMSVVSTGNGFIHLTSRDTDHCKQCAARAGCGIQLLNKAMIWGADNIPVEVSLDVQENIQSGDEITVAIDDGKLICLSLLQYFFPIMLLVVTTVVTDVIIQLYQINEIWVILAAFLALCIAMIMVRYLSVPLTNSAGKIFETECAELTYNSKIQPGKNQD